MAGSTSFRIQEEDLGRALNGQGPSLPPWDDYCDIKAETAELFIPSTLNQVVPLEPVLASRDVQPTPDLAYTASTRSSAQATTPPTPPASRARPKRKAAALTSTAPTAAPTKRRCTRKKTTPVRVKSEELGSSDGEAWVPEPKARKSRKADHIPRYVCREEQATLRPHGLPEVEAEVNNYWVYLFFRFCAERHRMYEKREPGMRREDLTTDETLRKTRVGNIFRDLDTGSTLVKAEIIEVGGQSIEEICFRLFLFCGFYELPTWHALVEGLGEIPSWKNFDLEKYEKILYHRSFVQGKTIYTSRFQLVPPTRYFGGNLPHFAASLRFVKALMEMGLHEKLAACDYAVDASHIILTIPTLGPFLSLNMLCYLNDTRYHKFYYRNYASCGPGSRAFLTRMFGPVIGGGVAYEQAGLAWLFENQWRYWARIGEDPPYAHKITGIRPGMRVLDFENALCWCHRYVNDFQHKSWGSVADMAEPAHDENAENASMPAWCDQEMHVGMSSKVAFVGDYDEAKVKLDSLGEEVYEVEKVVCRLGNRRNRNGLFRIRWKGYTPEEDTWERAANLSGAEEALQEWLDWEETVFGTIARIQRDHPYVGPARTKSAQVPKRRSVKQQGDGV